MKFDSEKNRLELLPHKALVEVAKVMTYGAKKYSSLDIKKILDTCQKKDVHLVMKLQKNSLKTFAENVIKGGYEKTENKISVNDVIKQELFIVKECVVPVMKQTEFLQIQKYLNKEDSTQKNIEKIIEKGYVKWREKEIKLLKGREGIENYNLKISSNHIIYLQKNINFSKKEDVKYAETKNIYTLIMIMKQENSEECYVANATTVWECWEIVLRELQKLSIISKDIIIQEKEFQNKGEWNWEKISASRYYGAALRHLTSWYMGEDVDSETGINHLAHAVCCIMFMLEGLEDDRHYKKTSYPRESFLDTISTNNWYSSKSKSFTYLGRLAEVDNPKLNTVKITVGDSEKKAEFVLPFDADIWDWSNVFRAILMHQTFSNELISKLLNNKE